MTEKEKKEAKKEGSSGMEEKRVKPNILRRRAAAHAPEKEEKAPEVKVEEVLQVEPKKADEKKAVVEEKPGKGKKTAARGAKAEDEASHEVAHPKGKKGAIRAEREEKKVVIKKLTPQLKKTTSETFELFEKVAAEEEEALAAAGKQGAAKEVAEEVPKSIAAKVEVAPDDASHPKKREVKVFDKDDKREKLFYTKQPFRKAKSHYKDKAAASQHARPLKKTEITVTKAEKRVVRMVDAVSVGELSQTTGVRAGEIIKKLMDLGIMATVNQFIDFDTTSLIAPEFGFEVVKSEAGEDTLLGVGSETHDNAEMLPRAPVVTVMGHVDHGKTSLLDAIRRTNVVSGEAGGITQHIGAYHVHLEKGDVTFLDTPGHEAFTAMRARGAKVTDIVVLVVAANDGVMPQTIEAINHAKAAGVPIIVAVNKIDLPDANADKVRQALTEYHLVSEAWGGETIFVEVSAKKNIKIKELLELILLQAEILQLKAAPSVPARGVIVEAKLDKGRGPVATVLVQNGTLKVGDACIAGVAAGRVRAMVSDWGKRITEAGPSMPVEILGLSEVPVAGDTFSVVKDEATAKQLISIRQRKVQEVQRQKTAKVSLSDLYDKISKGEVKELNVIIKGDVQGSVEAVKEAVLKIQSDKVGVKVIHTGAGGVNEGDVMLASASSAIIIGFNVRPEPKASQLAETEGVDIRMYNIIYNVVDDIKKAMEGLLSPIVTEVAAGRAEIREVFKLTKAGVIAGCYVVDGKIPRSARVRLVRDSVVVYDGKIASLKRFKDDVREVASGFECGIGIEGYNDLKAGDVIEAYELKHEAAKL